MMGDLRGLSLTLRASLPENASLRPGQTLTLPVQRDAEGAFLRLGEQRVPLPQNSGLNEGQRVQATLRQEGTTTRIEVAPLPATTPSETAPLAPKPDTSALMRLLPGLLQKLAPAGSVESAASILPQQLPPTAAQTSPVLQLLLSPGTPAPAVATVLQWLGAARQSGKMSDATLTAMSALLDTAPEADDTMLTALKSLAHATRNEARLAQGSPPGADDLRTLLAALLEDDGLRAFVKEQGGEKEFREAARALLSRLDAGATANLHGLERGYTFFEIPFAWQLGFQRAQVHVFSEGEAKGGAKRAPATVVLDLSLDTLGPLWVQLRRDTHSTDCDLCAEWESTRDALHAERDSLAAQLAEAGLPAPRVRVMPWREADRPERLAALLAPPRPLDVGA